MFVVTHINTLLGICFCLHSLQWLIMFNNEPLLWYHTKKAQIGKKFNHQSFTET